MVPRNFHEGVYWSGRPTSTYPNLPASMEVTKVVVRLPGKYNIFSNASMKVTSIGLPQKLVRVLEIKKLSCGSYVTYGFHGSWNFFHGSRIGSFHMEAIMTTYTEAVPPWKSNRACTKDAYRDCLESSMEASLDLHGEVTQLSWKYVQLPWKLK